MRWLRDTRTGRVVRYTDFLAAQPHFEETTEPPRQEPPQRSDPPAREAEPAPVVVVPAKEAPPVEQSAPSQEERATARTEPALPDDDPAALDCKVRIADRVKIERRKNAGKRHHQPRG